MRNSLFIQIIPLQIKNSIKPNFSTLQENILEEFWKLNNELKKCKDKYLLICDLKYNNKFKYINNRMEKNDI